MRALLLLMVVVATLPMAFRFPIIGLIEWIGFSYMNPHRIAFGFATGFQWVMITAVITIIGIMANPSERQGIRFNTLTFVLVVFIAWTGITSLFAVRPDLAEPKFIEFFKIQMMVFASLILAIDRRRFHWIVWAIVLSFGFWGFKGGVFTLSSGGGYHVLGPIKSFFRDNNNFALVMCMTLPMMRYLQLQAANPWIKRGMWVLIGLTVVSVLGTQSRGGFLGLGMITLMLVLKSRNRIGLIFVATIVGSLALSFMPQTWYDRMSTINSYEEDQSAQGRFDSWHFATNVAIAKPFTGGGFDVWASDSMWDRHGPPGAKHRAIHSIYFQILAEQGFIGLGLFLSMLLIAWRRLSKIKKMAKRPDGAQWTGDLAGMLQVSLAGYLAAGAFLPMPYFDLLYQVIALSILLEGFALTQATSEQTSDSRKQKRRGKKRPAKGRSRTVVGSEPARVRGVQDLPNF